MNFLVKKDHSAIVMYNILLVILSFTFIFLSVTYSLLFLIFLIPTILVMVLYDTSLGFTSCNIQDGTLTYKTGLFKYQIKLDSIVQVNESVNIYPSLALSCDRIRIATKINDKYKTYYISVVEKEKLIALLKESIKEEIPVTEKEQNIEEKAKDTKEKEVVKAETEKTEIKKEEPKKETAAKKTTTKKATTKKTTDKKESK